jgi:hypothetical protein
MLESGDAVLPTLSFRAIAICVLFIALRRSCNDFSSTMMAATRASIFARRAAGSLARTCSKVRPMIASASPSIFPYGRQNRLSAVVLRAEGDTYFSALAISAESRHV